MIYLIAFVFILVEEKHVEEMSNKLWIELFDGINASSTKGKKLY